MDVPQLQAQGSRGAHGTPSHGWLYDLSRGWEYSPVLFKPCSSLCFFPFFLISGEALLRESLQQQPRYHRDKGDAALELLGSAHAGEQKGERCPFLLLPKPFTKLDQHNASRNALRALCVYVCACMYIKTYIPI